MTTSRYATDANPFQREYAENALLQKGFNNQIITDLAQFILRKYPWATSRPITILDLCCGDGGATNQLLAELEKNGIKVQKIVGIDVSRAQIERAQAYAAKDARLEFNVQDVEKMAYSSEFDVVVSLFGLHWIEDLNHTAQLISQALKKDGSTVFFAPLEKNDFFALRQKMMASPEWRDHFKNFAINPFADTPNDYLSSFSKYFTSENNDGISGDQPVFFTAERFARFLSSWMQEVRQLTSSGLDADAYLKQLINGIEASDDPTSDVTTFKVGCETKIRFLEKFFWYHGTKKDDQVDDALTAPHQLRQP